MTDEQERTPDDETSDAAEQAERAAQPEAERQQPDDTQVDESESAEAESVEDAPQPQATRMEPPRAFDDEAAPAEGDTAAEEPAEPEPEPEVVAENVEPEAAEAFEDLDQLPSLLEALLF